MPETAPTPVAPATATTETATPAETPTQAPDSVAQLKALEEKTKADAFRAMDAARRHRKERERFDKTNSELQAKLNEAETRLKQREAEEADEKRYPAKYFERRFGPKWKDALANVSITETVTPDMVASEMDERLNRFKSEAEAREKKLRDEWAQKEQERAQSEAEQARLGYANAALEHIKSNSEKYPLLNRSGLASNVGQYIQNHFMKTSQTDIDGNPTPGKLLTAEEAASMMEGELKEFLAKLQPTQSSDANLSGNGSDAKNQTQRRTLSNTLSARSPTGWVPPKNEAERLQRAYAAWDEGKQGGTKH